MDLDALYEAVFAAPGDDGPRLVLADALQEVGDPRGEFLSLSLQSRRTQRSERRLAKLLERHRAGFLRGLAPMIMPAHEKWERGFLSEASLLLEGLHVDTPDLATLEKVEVLYSPAAPLELSSPHMRSLREVTMAPLTAVSALFDAPRPLGIEHVGLSGPGDLNAWLPSFTETIGQARSLPKLTRLVLRSSRANFDETDWLWKLPVLGRLRSLEFDGSFRGVPLMNVLPMLRQLETVPGSVVFSGVGITMKVRSADGFRSLQVEVEPPSGVMVFAAMLDTLSPDALDDLTVTSTAPLDPALTGTLRMAAKRLKLTNLSLPSAQSRMKWQV
jgi:uncharacterized protein (TIGR02996 family)